jgi:hypothetical protein
MAPSGGVVVVKERQRSLPRHHRLKETLIKVHVRRIVGRLARTDALTYLLPLELRLAARRG